MFKIIRYRLYYSLLVFIVASLFACQRDGDAYDADQLGELSLKVELDSDQTQVITKSAEVDYSDFAVRVLKDGAVYASYIYGDMPESVSLKVGEYDLKAYWGNNYPVAFDSPYYEGIVPFEVIQAEQVYVTVPCSMANAQLTFSFSELFEKVFTNYSVRITNEYYDTSDGYFYYSKGESRDVNVIATDIYLTLILQKYDGNMYTYTLNTITDVEGGNNYLINLDTEFSDDASIIVSIDETTNDIQDSYEISSDWMTKNEPVIMGTKSSGYVVKSIYGYPTIGSFTSTIISEGEIQSLKLSSSSDDFAALGLGSEVELVDISSADYATLESFGVTFDDLSAGQNSISFTKMLEYLSVGEHEFKLNLIDIYNQTASYSITFDIIDYLPVTAPSPEEGDIWPTKVYLPNGVTFSDFSEIDINNYPNSDDIYYEFKSSTGDWEQVDFGSSDKIEKSGLTAGSTCYYRVGLNGVYSDAISIATESALQHGNNTLESWSYSTLSSSLSKVDITVWYPSTSASSTSGYWGTNNETTTGASGALYYYYNRYSGTQRSTDKNSGTYAARLATVGWGINSWSFTSAGSIINVTCGELRSTSSGSDGISFTSRPTSLKFYYKYTPYNSNSMEAYVIVENRDNGTVELGRGSFISGTKVSSYTAKTVDVTYDDSYTHLKATHLRLIFRSASSSGLDDDDVYSIQGSYGVIYAYADSRTEGSVLYIDDVELVY